MFLRALRRSRGMSQADVAGLVGTDQGVVSAYEHDRRVPSAEMLNRIVVACGYVLVATDDRGRQVRAPLPRRGWFPDDDLPAPDPDDPAGEEPTLDRDAPMDERVTALRAALDTAVAVLDARPAHL